jgi:small subunit ribosomal protein S20
MPRVPKRAQPLFQPWENSLPNIKAAVKWVRQSEKRELRNRDVKTRLKTLFKKAHATGETETVRGVESQFDKAATKGIIHPNKAARKKSRLVRAARIKAATPAPAVAAKPARKKAAPKKAEAKAK